MVNIRCEHDHSNRLLIERFNKALRRVRVEVRIPSPARSSRGTTAVPRILEKLIGEDEERYVVLSDCN